MTIKALIFDLDGTLADTIPLTVHSFREVTRVLTGKNLSDDEVIREFGPIDTEIIMKLVDNENRNISADSYFKHFSDNFDNFVKPIDGIKELLSYVKSIGLKTALFTGRSLRGTIIVLEKLGYREYFDLILTGDNTTKPKPDPEGILLALDRLGIESEDAVYTGDLDVDVNASKAAGTLSVLALWSSSASKDMMDSCPDKYFDSPFEFISWLKSVQG